MRDEYVLCVPSSIDLPTGFIPHSEAIFLDILRHATHYMHRPRVETNPKYKQIATYCMVYSFRFTRDLTTESEGLLAYQRPHKGMESRLDSLWSIGIGGHVNYDDMMGRETYQGIEHAFRRELTEEVEYPYSDWKRPDIIGFINDDSNDVGRHHIGIVGMIIVPPGSLKVHAEFPAWTWLNICPSSKDIPKYESWSQILIRDFLGKL